MRRAAKKDANHNEIKQALENVGAYVHDTHQLKNAFDCLVYYKGNTYTCEIKGGKNKLTEGESACKEKIERAGVCYNILRSTEDALRMIGFIQSTATDAITWTIE